MNYWEIGIYVGIILSAIISTVWEYNTYGTFYSPATIIALGAFVLGIFNRNTVLKDKKISIAIELKEKQELQGDDAQYLIHEHLLSYEVIYAKLLHISVINKSVFPIFIKKIVITQDSNLVCFWKNNSDEDNSVIPRQAKCFEYNGIDNETRFYTNTPVQITVITDCGFEKTEKLNLSFE